MQAGGSRVDSGEEVWRGYTSRGEQTSHYMTLYMYICTLYMYMYMCIPPMYSSGQNKVNVRLVCNDRAAVIPFSFHTRFVFVL